MEPILLIHGYSSEGKTDKDNYTLQDVEALFGTLRSQLSQMFNVDVTIVNVSRYISLDDSIGIDDLSLAMDRALRSLPQALRDQMATKGFNVITHSTGALVARNWVRRHSKNSPCKVKRICHLAGANNGSGWAHIGESLVAKWGRGIFQGTQRGLAVLESLELGSDWTIDLHRHFYETGQKMFADYGVMEFCVIGSQVPPQYMLIPFRYGKEDGSDGVVRVSSCNVNVNYLRIGPSNKGLIDWKDADDFSKHALPKLTDAQKTTEFHNDTFAGDYYVTEQVSIPDPGTPPENIDDHRPVVPFAIPYETCHSDEKMGVVSGTQNRAQVLECIKNAFMCNTLADYQACVEKFNAVTKQTYELVAHPDHKKNLLESLKDEVLTAIFQDPQGQYDGHSQIVLRVRDQNGHALNDFSVYFNTYGGDTAAKRNQPIDNLFEDKHKNNKNGNIVNFYLRTTKWNDHTKQWDDRIPLVNGIDLEIDVLDSSPERILFIPLRMRIPNQFLVKFLKPHQTTIIDVQLLRLPSNVAFMIPTA